MSYFFTRALPSDAAAHAGDTKNFFMCALPLSHIYAKPGRNRLIFHAFSSPFPPPPPPYVFMANIKRRGEAEGKGE